MVLRPRPQATSSLPRSRPWSRWTSLCAVLACAACVDVSRPLELGAHAQEVRDSATPTDDASAPAQNGEGGAGGGVTTRAEGGNGGFAEEPDASPDQPTTNADTPADTASTGAPADVDPGTLAPGSNGYPCTGPETCLSGICADGVCCATVCTGACVACNVPAAPGVCTNVPSGQDIRHACAPQAPATCGRTGACDGNGACRLHPAGTVCATNSCVGQTESSQFRCDGKGVCSAGVIRACGNYLCSGDACAAACTDNRACATGNVCFAPTCTPKTNVPALAWRFDEASGSAVSDASGNGFTGTMVGNFLAQPTPSSMVPTLKFPNTGSRTFTRTLRTAVQLSPLPAALKPANNVTVMAWYRATSVDPDTSPIPAAEIVSGGDQYVIRIRANDVEFAKHIAGQHVKCDGPVAGHLDGRWHHVAGVTTPAGMKVYFDGVEKGSNTIGDPIVYDRGPDLWVGRHGNGGTVWDFDGNIDEVRIYTRAFLPAEIAAIADGGN